MRPTQILRSGDPRPLGKFNHFVGDWGHFGGLKQKGIITYSLSSNQQNPFAGAAKDAVFNTWRRFSTQVLYFAPPFIVAYYAINWAVDRNHYLNSKPGRQEFAGEE